MKNCIRRNFLLAVFLALLLMSGVIWGSQSARAAALPAPDAPNAISSIGDFVWHDLDFDGQQDPGELGIDGVQVEIYLDMNNNGTLEPNIDKLEGSMLTGDDPSTPGPAEKGWYLFNVDFGPGKNYLVSIPASNFASGQPLANYLLTSGSTYAPNPTFVVTEFLAGVKLDVDFGFASTAITLAKSVYLGHNNGGSCATAGESVSGVNGTQITYCFKVTNTGADAYLAQLTINDPSLGINIGNLTLASGTLPLAPNASATYYYQTTITKDLLPNTATASGTPVNSGGTPYPDAPKPTSTDTANVDLVAPAIEVQKTVYLGQNGGGTCPGGSEKVYGTSGTQVTYCFVVTNRGDTYLNNISLSDTTLGITIGNMTLKNGAQPLAPGATLVYYYHGTITQDLVNTAATSGTPSTAAGTTLPGVPVPSDTDTAEVDRVAPAIDIQKTVYRGQNAGGACNVGVESIPGINGTLMTYCFKVTNTGDTYLTGVTINDATLGINQGSMVLLSGSLPLAPNASLVYYYQSTITRDLTNTATASGTPSDVNGNPLPGVNNPSKSDTAAVDLVAPDVRLAKSVYLGHNAGAACPGSEQVAGLNGTQITYCFVVTNTGDTHLNNFTLVDVALGVNQSNLTLKSGALPLAPNATLIYYYQTTITKDLLPNTATVSAIPTDATGTALPGVPNPTHNDTANVDEVAPAVDVQKTVYLGHNNGVSCPGLETAIGTNGAQVTYCFRVVNIGDTHLASITLDDLDLSLNIGNLTLKSGTLPLAPGAAVVYYYQTAITKDLTNRVAATANPVDASGNDLPGLPNPTDSDTANVDQVNAQIDLVKTLYLGNDNGASCPGLPTLTVANGSTVTYCFVVTNTGDTYLNDIQVNDPTLNVSTPVIRMRPGVLPLAPGGKLTFYYATAVAGDLNNTATATGNPVDANGNDLPGVNNPTDTGSATVDAQGPGIRLNKTVYLNHNSGATCPGVDLLNGVNKAAAITYCFQIINTGDSYLGDIELSDPQLGLTIGSLRPLSGTVPLAPGKSLYYYYETVLNTSTTNTASTTGNPVDANGNDLPGVAKPSYQDTATANLKGGSISGTVWMDKNANGIADPDEKGIPGVTITLSNGRTVITDQDGNYLFDNLTDGTYSVTETDLPGYISTGDKDGGNFNLISNLVINNGNDIVDQDFLDAPQFGRIIGVVFNDLNGNVIQDSNEPGLPGVTVTLANGRTTTTDPTGHYTFTNVLPGFYTVVETDPPGFSSTTNNTVPVVVPANGTAVANFGDKQIGSISGVVFNDLNGDGVKQPNENGLGGVVVQLLNEQGTVINTTTTAPNGSYAFTDVTPGSYTVRELDPTGYNSTTSNTVPVSVPPAGSATANFGDQQVGTISGVVFNDKDGNGLKSPDEEGLANVAIQLVDNQGRVIATISTGPDGSYLFTGVQPGSYTVRETDPPNYTSTTSNNVPVSVLPGGGAIANFGDQQVGTVSGVVFNDINGDGEKQPNESPLSGVIVQLYDKDNKLVNTTTTDPNGAYIFTNVPPGAYTVREIDPPKFTSTTANTVPVSVPAGGAATANFGDQQIGSITGVVFNDINGDGVQNPNEPPLSGVKVDLLDATGKVLTSTLTSGDGSYQFVNLRPSAYIVRETDPTGYTSTTKNDVQVVVPPGGMGIANFGDLQRSSVSGVVFNDVNGDGRKDSNENGIGGVLLELVDSTGKVISSTLTVGDGSYAFPNVPPGDYTVRETDPKGYTSTTPNTVPITVPSGGSATANFGDRQVGTISGIVFNDTNGNGLQGSNENGIGGVKVELYSPTGVLITSTVTAGDGSYSFINLPPGNYTVVEVDPPKYASTTNNIVPVTVPNGGTAIANFGDRQVNSICGVVYNDVNRNGKQDADEKGIGSVVVQLTDATGKIIGTVVTSGNGEYCIVNVPPGQYTLTEIDLNGSISTTPNSVTVNVGTDPVSVNFGDEVVFPKAIALDRFYAEAKDGKITIIWATTVEIDTEGYYILRSEDGQRSSARQLTPAMLTSRGVLGGDYSFTDSDVAMNQTYTYWLVEVTTDGKRNDYGPVQMGLYSERVYLSQISKGR